MGRQVPLGRRGCSHGPLSAPPARFLWPAPSSASASASASLASRGLFRKRAPGLLLGGGRGSMPRILWICRNANMRRACWGQTTRQDPSARGLLARLSWPRADSGGLPGVLDTLLATAELTSPLGVKNCTGSRLRQLVVSTVPGSPSEFQRSLLARGTLDPASPGSALIKSNLTLSTEGHS